MQTKFNPNVNAKKARSCKDGAKNPLDGGCAKRDVDQTIHIDFTISAPQSTAGNKMMRQSLFQTIKVRKT